MALETKEIKITASLIIPCPAKVPTFLYVLNAKDEKWSPPAGKVDLFESFENAAIRETREETGLAAIIRYPLGIYQFKSESGNHIVNVAYAAHVFSFDRMEKAHNIEQIGLFTLIQLYDLHAQGKIRAGKANIDPVEDYLAGVRLSPKSIKSYF